ncbi:SGNH/GDSL hydrolase family protein [Chitinophaga lutea]
MKTRLLLLTALLGMAISGHTLAQGRYDKDISRFKSKDSVSMPAPGGVLFVGSSSFTRWKELENVFRSYGAINRGFGGSQLKDAIYYAEDIVYPYKPRQVVIYSGENDIAAGVSADATAERFRIFFSLLRKHLPAARISYISIKPGPTRAKFIPQVKEANKLIAEFLEKQPNTDFIDVFGSMVKADGQPKGEIFVEDGVHMNQQGYDIWIGILKPYLDKAK